MIGVAAYYNEFDPKAAAWLRELIKQGHIADGEVDERSILDVQPDELRGYTQCHFFAGIGGWSYALRLAGWADDRPVWTGSPPCQPFSSAGRGDGRADERHLAPHFVDLVRACRPGVLFGEQVASADVFGKVAGGARKQVAGTPQWAWFDDLCDRLEAARYAVGASDIPSAGVGAPHIRQRTFFGAVGLADADDAGSQGRGRVPERAGECAVGAGCVGGRLADAEAVGRGKECQDGGRVGAGNGEEGRAAGYDASGEYGGLADADGDGSQQGREAAEAAGHGHPAVADGGFGWPDAPDGFWRDADWLFCRDGKWRPVEPGTFPLAYGVSARVGRLRGYGNAIVPQAAATFVMSFMDVINDADTVANIAMEAAE